MPRVFLAARTGDGTRADFWRPDLGADFWGYVGKRFMWPVEHPDTNEPIGYICVFGGDVAPVGSIDLGDPYDDVSLRQTSIGDQVARDIGQSYGFPWGRVKNATGEQVIAYLNKTNPLMMAEFDGALLILLDRQGA